MVVVVNAVLTVILIHFVKKEKGDEAEKVVGCSVASAGNGNRTSPLYTDASKCVTSVPYRWRSQNKWHSI